MGSEIDAPGYVAAATDQIQKAEQQTKAVLGWVLKKEQQAEDIQNDPNYPVQQGVLHGPHPTPSEEEKLTQDLDNVLKAKNIPEAATDKLVQENLESFNQVEATRKEAETGVGREWRTEGALNEEKPSEPQDPAPEAEAPVIKTFLL
jgi:cell division septum initiation protein DivIVA